MLSAILLCAFAEALPVTTGLNVNTPFNSAARAARPAIQIHPKPMRAIRTNAISPAGPFEHEPPQASSAKPAAINLDTWTPNAAAIRNEIAQIQAYSRDQLARLVKSGTPDEQYKLISTRIDGPDAPNVQADAKWAAPILEKLSEQGHGPSTILLGELYENGVGVEQRLTTATKLYTKATETDSFVIAAVNIERMAERGNPIAQFTMAEMLRVGKRNLVRNESGAKKWYLKALAGGFPDASLALSKMLSAESALYTQNGNFKAAKTSANAAKRYMELYHSEMGTSVPNAAAEVEFVKAGSGPISKKLDLFSSKNGGLKSYTAKQAATIKATGTRNDLYNLASAYEQGTVAQQHEAFAIFKKLGDDGDALSALRVGEMYESGRGVEQNSAASTKYYLQVASSDIPIHGALHLERQANLGLPKAQMAMGDLRQFELGVSVDMNLAQKWYEKAAATSEHTSHGLPEAEYQLSRIFFAKQRKARDEGFTKEADRLWRIARHYQLRASKQNYDIDSDPIKIAQEARQNLRKEQQVKEVEAVVNQPSEERFRNHFPLEGDGQ